LPLRFPASNTPLPWHAFESSTGAILMANQSYFVFITRQKNLIGERLPMTSAGTDTVTLLRLLDELPMKHSAETAP
jgi:hypothetical protein